MQELHGKLRLHARLSEEQRSQAAFFLPFFFLGSSGMSWFWLMRTLHIFQWRVRASLLGGY
jgi:hypothetical protein